MGFLKRRSHESKTGPGALEALPWSLPPAPRKLYMPDALPSTDGVRIFNAEWLIHDTGSGMINSANAQANMILRGLPKEQLITSAVLDLTKYVQSKMGDSELAETLYVDLFNAVWLGGGFALLEQMSGQLLSGLVHPSIWNAMVYEGTVESRESQRPVGAGLVLSKAREGGYSALRHQMAPGQVFADCDFAG
jgi:hypothetical protein